MDPCRYHRGVDVDHGAICVRACPMGVKRYGRMAQASAVVLTSSRLVEQRFRRVDALRPLAQAAEVAIHADDDRVGSRSEEAAASPNLA